MKKDKGFTLIELLIAVAVFGVITVALGFEFVDWQGKYNVESQIKVLYDDMMNARIKAMQRKRVHFVVFPDTTSYTIIEDSDEDEAAPVDPGDTVLATFPKSTAYTLNSTGVGIPAIFFTFSQRGLVSPNATIWLTTTTVDSDYDCIILEATRINMGKWDGATTSCNAK